MSQPISISLTDLTNHPETLREEIESGLGSKDGALGIIVIKDLPLEFHHLRQKLFKLGYILANLPEEQQRGLERPETSFLFGWSHGKEVMNGRPDFQKGSFYANPLYDGPDADLKDAHPEYYAGNNWPSGIPELREFEETFKSLGKIIFDVGCHLAKACEAFVSENVDGVHVDSIEKLISQSQCNKARLLHYYPIAPTEQNVDSSHDALCGTHLDHSLLTGLCSAMYLTPTPTGTEETSGPPESGLWIYPRSSTDAVKVSIPKDCLGEALQVLTGGKLAATPHYVSGNMPNGSEQISRETFAFFLQPNVNAVIGTDGETFGQFTKRVIQRHYADR